MMREIKFRAWKHTGTPEMFNDVQVIDFKSGIAHLGYSLSSFTERTDKERLDNLILMQYTGLKDVNGMEIYEGDVVEYTDLWSGQSYINEIYWKFGSLVFDVEFEEEKRYTVPIHSIHMDDDRGYEQTLKVLGNIYENPELLGDSQ